MRKTSLVLILLVVIVASIPLSFYFATRSEATPFTLKVIPDMLKGDAITGQRVVFLVTVENDDSIQDGQAVKISASASRSEVSVEPMEISPEQVAEVNVIPDVSSVGSNITVTVNAERGGLKHSQTIDFTVIPGEDFLGEYAMEVRDKFVPWLAASHPELGITNETQWTGTIVSPRWLVVSHYLFFSNDWEMHIYWHIMIPPYDWGRIDLRHRFTETVPSLSFEITSLTEGVSPGTMDPPESVWR